PHASLPPVRSVPTAYAALKLCRRAQLSGSPHPVSVQLPQIIDRPACWCRSALLKGRRTRAPVHRAFVPASSGATVGRSASLAVVRELNSTGRDCDSDLELSWARCDSSEGGRRGDWLVGWSGRRLGAHRRILHTCDRILR
uniref:BTB domain-containing protein n=1 Tax=Macrostomum lignano TaxID=282301 RepID=A0A1I8FP41_9PLAT